jgi:CBS domain-containing protein
MHNVRVKEIMIGNVITATPDTPILKLGSIMLLERVRRIPIVSGKKLVGIVSQGEVHRAAFKCYGSNQKHAELTLAAK